MLLATGSVPAWTHLQDHFPIPFEMEFHAGGFAAALALSAGFAALVALRARLPHSGLKLWVGALSLAWGLAMTLWLPWLDAAKSYRAVFEDMARHVPDGCGAMRRLGESERAMVEYYTPLRATTVESSCDAILWMGNAVTGKHRPREGWVRVWSGARPGEKAEKFELFLRQSAH